MRTCRLYGSARGCNYGARCYFSHEDPESVPICRQFGNTQSCRFGNNCKYRHSEIRYEIFDPAPKMSEKPIYKIKEYAHDLNSIIFDKCGYTLTYIGEQYPINPNKNAYGAITNRSLSTEIPHDNTNQITNIHNIIH